MDPGLAAFLLVLGLPSVIWPYKVAQFEERIDAIGSKRSWSEVEPAGWKVIITRIGGIAAVMMGAYGLFAN